MTRTAAEIIAEAILGAGADIVTHVPGHGGTQVFDALRLLSGVARPVSYHEEVAYTVAHGAGLVGRRSAVLLKSHGLVKAGNSVLDSLSAGTTAGMLTLVFDDVEGAHSDSIFDVAAFLTGIGMPYQRASGEYYRDVAEGFAASERLRLPHALIIEAHAVETSVGCERVPSPDPPAGYVRDVAQHFVGPFFTRYQQQVLSAKQRGESWTAIGAPTIPRIPDDLPAPFRAAVGRYRPLFEVFGQVRGEIATGDTSVSSLYALPPYDCIDIVTYMGGSIPLAVGAHLAGYSGVWAVTGDFSFIAAGHLGLLEAVQRGIPLKVLILANGVAEATGGQPIPDHLLPLLLAGANEHVRYIHHPSDPGEIRAVLTEASGAEELRIIVANYRDA